MFIYLLKNQALKESINFQGNEPVPYLGSWYVYDYNGVSPHIDVKDIFGVICKTQSQLPDFFLKATEVVFPNYISKRELGIYHFGKAKAELTIGQNSPFCLKIETDSWDGIQDMITIQEKIAAGKIYPTTSYERKQVRLHPLEILRQLLASRNLTSFQRFFLALRLTK